MKADNNNLVDSIDRSVLQEKLGFRIRMADRAFFRDFVQTVGMTPVQYSVFTLVGANEGMPQGTIGEALSMDRASTMAIMDKLVKAGFVERRKSTVDRRMYAMYLTTKGRKELEAVEKKVKETDGRFRKKLGGKQVQELIGYLDLLMGS